MQAKLIANISCARSRYKHSESHMSLILVRKYSFSLKKVTSLFVLNVVAD